MKMNSFCFVVRGSFQTFFDARFQVCPKSEHSHPQGVLSDVQFFSQLLPQTNFLLLIAAVVPDDSLTFPGGDFIKAVPQAGIFMFQVLLLAGRDRTSREIQLGK
jgi:hypothetical protein